MEDIHDIRPRYEQLGIYLRLRDSDIEVIKIESDGDTWLCLKNVIVKWLNMNTTVSEVPNRRLLV